jgi:hypothetical protein
MVRQFLSTQHPLQSVPMSYRLRKNRSRARHRVAREELEGTLELLTLTDQRIPPRWLLVCAKCLRRVKSTIRRRGAPLRLPGAVRYLEYDLRLLGGNPTTTESVTRAFKACVSKGAE